MENNTLLGATDSVQQYDGSGVFNPNTPTSDVDPNYNPAPEATETEEASEKPGDTSSNSGLLLYAGAALLLYFFVFKNKK
jgi:hypothetical protein